MRSGCARAGLPKILDAVRAGDLNERERLAVHDLDRAWWRQLLVAPVLRVLNDVTSEQVRDAFAHAWQDEAPTMPENLDRALDVAADGDRTDYRAPLLRFKAAPR